MWLTIGAIIQKTCRMNANVKTMNNPNKYQCIAAVVCGESVGSAPQGQGRIIAGGDNGGLYVFQEGMCIKKMVLSGEVSTPRIGPVGKYGVCSLQQSTGGILYCGMSDGVVQAVDIASLTVLKKVSVLTGSVTEPPRTVGAARPRSASAASRRAPTSHVISQDDSSKASLSRPRKATAGAPTWGAY